MCSVPGCVARPGGGKLAASFATLCNHHKCRQRRHGDATQLPIRASHIAPYLASLRRRQKLHPEKPAWGLLGTRWEQLAQACRDIVKVYAGGTPMNSRKLEAAEALVKVADNVPPERVWQTAMAVVLMHEAEPRRFASEASYRVQLGRRVRHLTEANRGRYWNSTEMRFKLVYRDPSPRAAVIIGEMLLTAFGVAGVMFAKQEQAEADAKLAERQAFYDALHDVTPAAGR